MSDLDLVAHDLLAIGLDETPGPQALVLDACSQAEQDSRWRLPEVQQYSGW